MGPSFSKRIVLVQLNSCNLHLLVMSNKHSSLVCCPTEILHKAILVHIHKELMDTSLHRQNFYPWWLNIRHVSTEFHDILMMHLISYRDLSATFCEDNSDNRNLFLETCKLFVRCANHINTLCNARPFNIILDLTFENCKALNPSFFSAIFHAL